MLTWFIILEAADCVAAKVDPEKFAWASASEDDVAEVTGTMANGFGAKTSDKEPSKSISALFEVVGKVEAVGTDVAVGEAVMRKMKSITFQ